MIRDSENDRPLYKMNGIDDLKWPGRTGFLIDIELKDVGSVGLMLVPPYISFHECAILRNTVGFYMSYQSMDIMFDCPLIVESFWVHEIVKRILESEIAHG